MMDSFQAFIESHPLTKDQVEAMYTFLHDLRELEDYESVSIGWLMDVLVMYYE